MADVAKRKPRTRTQTRKPKQTKKSSQLRSTTRPAKPKAET